MTFWFRLRSWSRIVLHRSKSELEMDQELRFHMDACAEDMIRSGLSRDEAYNRAGGEFVNMERGKEECRDAAGIDIL